MAAPQLHPHPGRIRRLPDGSRRRGPRRRMASWRCYSRSFLLRLGQPTRSGFQLDDCLGHPTQSVAASCFSSGCSMTNIDTTARRPLSLVSRFARPPVTNRNSGASLRCARHSPDVKLLTSLFDWGECATDMCLGSKVAWDTAAPLGPLRRGGGFARPTNTRVEVPPELSAAGTQVCDKLRAGQRRVITMTSCFFRLRHSRAVGQGAQRFVG